MPSGYVISQEPQTPKKSMGTSVQLGAGIAQCHNYRGTDVASMPSATLHAEQRLHLQWPAFMRVESAPDAKAVTEAEGVEQATREGLSSSSIISTRDKQS